MLVTCGNFQSISVCSLMFKLNFTSFVIVTPAALVMVKCVWVHRNHFSKIYNSTVKILFCAETWHTGFLTRNKLFFEKCGGEKLVIHKSLLYSRRKLILLLYLSFYAPVTWNMSRMKQCFCSLLVSLHLSSSFCLGQCCKWIWFSFPTSSGYFSLSQTPTRQFD